MKILPFLAGLLLSALSCRGAEFDLGAPGTLSVDVPAGWTVKSEPTILPNGGPAGHAFIFDPSPLTRAKCLLTFVFTNKGPADPEALRTEVRRASERFISISVEKKLDVKDFTLAQGFGAYGALTDSTLVGREPKGEEYRVMGSGLIHPPADLLGVVTMLADSTTGPEFQAMIKLVESVRVKPKAK